MAQTLPLGAALRNLASTAIGVVETRIALLSTEWEEERARLARIGIAVCAVLFFAVMAFVSLGAFIVVLFWDTHRLWALGTVTFAFVIGAVVSALIAASALASKPRLFASTLAALAEDRAALVPPADGAHGA